MWCVVTHSIRTAVLAAMTAHECSMPKRQVVLAFFVGLTHDVGKFSVLSLVEQPRKLDPDELAEVRRHTRYGADALSRLHLPLELADAALHHHERFDGSGYPDGLRGDAIPVLDRVLAVADVFDALTSWRPYKPAWTRAEALAYLCHESGRLFDPCLVLAFMRVACRWPHTVSAVRAFGQARRISLSGD